MADIFREGETKIIPGAHGNIQKASEELTPTVVNGVTAVVFKSAFGPLNKAVELKAEDGYEGTFGTGLTTDAIREAIRGGAQTIIAVRLGTGGTNASLKLKNSDETEAVTIEAKYPGAINFSATIRAKLSDQSKKECIIYSDQTEFEKVEFASGEGEAKALVEAFARSKNFTVSAEEGHDADEIKNVSQEKFTAGENPDVTNTDYSNAFEQIEPFEINTICVDTDDTAVHALLQSFINRIFNYGGLAMAVVAEKSSVDLETRKEHAAAFDDEKMHYVLNAHVNENGEEIDSYQTAARVAGLIGAAPANSSLTNFVIDDFTEILELLTYSQIEDALQNGCIVLSYNRAREIRIVQGINTLIHPADNQDNGWKKIRRVKTRFELIRRMNEVSDYLSGKIDNDANGQKTAISQLQEVGNTMISEGKLMSCDVALSDKYPPDKDSAWFNVDVVDKDSMEHLYMFYRFRFSTNV